VNLLGISYGTSGTSIRPAGIGSHRLLMGLLKHRPDRHRRRPRRVGHRTRGIADDIIEVAVQEDALTWFFRLLDDFHFRFTYGPEQHSGKGCPPLPPHPRTRTLGIVQTGVAVSMEDSVAENRAADSGNLTDGARSTGAPSANEAAPVDDFTYCLNC
jgi:hypothetical protein